MPNKSKGIKKNENNEPAIKILEKNPTEKIAFNKASLFTNVKIVDEQKPENIKINILR